MQQDTTLVCTLTFTQGRYRGQRVHVFEEVNLGRDERCGLRLMDAGISRMHALLSPRHDADTFALVELGSTNGTRVNGELLRGQHLLTEGDEVALGEARAVVSFSRATRRDNPSKPILLEASIETLRESQLGHDQPAKHPQTTADREAPARSDHARFDAPPTVYFPLAGAGEISEIDQPAPWSIWRVDVLEKGREAQATTLEVVDQRTFGEAMVRMAWHRWLANTSLWPLRRSAGKMFAYEHIEPHLCSLDTFRGTSAQLALFLSAWLHDVCSRDEPRGWPMTHIFATGCFDEEGALRSVRGVGRKIARAALFARQHPEARCVMFVPVLDLDEAPEDVLARELDEVPMFAVNASDRRLLVIGLYPEQIGALLERLEAAIQPPHDPRSEVMT